MIVLTIVGVGLSIAAILLVASVEWLKRPRLEIVARHWQATLPVPWTFAAVEVRNLPVIRALGWLLVRQPAQGCEVTTEFRTPGLPAIVVGPVAARWSAQPEPIRSVPVLNAKTGAIAFVSHYDQTMVPQTLRMDVPAGGGGQEVGLAIQRPDGTAHAWEAESYAHADWKNPAWALGAQMYDVTVRVRGSGVSSSRRFSLNNLGPPNFAAFSALTAL
jgi:hypothetical protein